VSAGDANYADAVRNGLYTPLGDGDLDIAAIVTTLEHTGYRGWYVLEQDCALDIEPGPHGGPFTDVRRSLEFVETLT
jgi:inosose dehydratase